MKSSHIRFDGIIKDELREFLLWLEEEKKLRICSKHGRQVWQKSKDAWGYDIVDKATEYHPIHLPNEDLINEYMELT